MGYLIKSLILGALGALWGFAVAIWNKIRYAKLKDKYYAQYQKRMSAESETADIKQYYENKEEIGDEKERIGQMTDKEFEEYVKNRRKINENSNKS